MYAWIWRRLPFGLPGRLAGSVILVAAAGALLWFWIFPWAEPLLPFDDVQVGPGDSGPAGEIVEDPFAVPYSTESNNASPSASPSR